MPTAAGCSAGLVLCQQKMCQTRWPRFKWLGVDSVCQQISPGSTFALTPLPVPTSPVLLLSTRLTQYHLYREAKDQPERPFSLFPRCSELLSSLTPLHCNTPTPPPMPSIQGAGPRSHPCLVRRTREGGKSWRGLSGGTQMGSELGEHQPFFQHFLFD